MSATKLVIVESPAKAATIKGYLGPDYHVTASIGHIRDLPQPSELPKDMKKGPFGRFAVNVDDGFTPYYVVNPDKKKKVTELRKLLKESDELFLATDEDREGEAIAWHLLQVLKPKVPVRRMVFHEITKEAIQRALDNTRDLDTALVDAQETRRILDRLYGYEVSPLLWRKIRPSLSAGRVQSVATRLVVARERDRMAHVSAEYWSIDTSFTCAGQAFGARVTSVDGAAIATGSDFSEKGELSAKAVKSGILHLDEATARSYAQALTDAPGSVIDSVTRKPYRRRPAAPFTTSTLQQEASRKLHWNASSTMRTAQSLYESGYITYMRTDSTALSGQAIHAARQQATQLYGADAVAEAPRTYGAASKGAQEAHEAIRPAGDHFRTPGEVASSLSKQQLALYDLIWKRTVASQMADALGYTATIRVLTGIDVDGKRHDVLSSASGTVITTPGFRLAYEEGRDRGRYEAEKNDAEKTLPDVAEGDAASLTRATPDGHETQPPGRYTEATLVKTMEELGIGRPSTYAATIQTIGDRGYVTHRGQYLVPTWLAFSVTRLLEENLANLVDYDFTASMEGDLDRIAAGEENGTEFLSGFFFGPDGSGEVGGLRHDVASLGDDIDARAVNSIDLGRGVTLRVGRYGPYMEKADGTRANVPPEVAPDELGDQLVDQLFSRAADDGRELGVDPDTGHTIIVKDGRYGPYVTEVLPEPEGDDGAKAKKSAAKPRTASLFKTMDISTVTLSDALQLLSLPREVGVDPASGEAITAQNGRYGPYLKKGTDSRTLSSEDQLLSITLEQALAIYAQPKTRGRTAARPPLREFGEDPISGKKVTVKDGRFGPYVTDGETNVTVPRAETVEDLTAERAYELLADKRAKGPAPKRARKTVAKKTTTKKKATVKKPAAKKTSAKKTATKER
ncbi:DNA topoisomerase I [Schaalia meyeri]|uniref:type I DNA topoisomerase n=1 Tax=Schaalia meyeri TaxID=52773 RepID=UPI00067F97F0|nr:type I DNA topoisomerase [Schaalia meyeri]AKU65492.1 DNA topoisomerase I [Schaalia meyeri]